MNCPKCQTSLADNTAYCPGCGTFLTGVSSDATAGGERPATQPEPPARKSHDPAELPTVVEPIGASLAPTIGVSPVAYDTLQPGAQLGDRYEIVSVLGVGGMGIVYRARDLKLVRDVALKVIRPDLLQDPAIAERFRREILLSSQITHKNILRVHDLGESDGLAYISMNFVEGETLQDLLKREGPLPPEKVASLAIQLCAAMAAAHDASVIHRDLKPQNILLDKEGTAYIADFGISRSLEAGETMTRQGAILGTVDYMSPEQARGETPDHRGDIYSLGMVLYRMLVGALPFRDEQLSSITAMLRRVQEEVPDIQTLRPDVPKWLASIVSRALRREPTDRYQSMAEMRHDLEKHTATVSWRQVLRPRLVLPVAALIVVLAVVAAAVSLAPRLLSSGEGGAIATLPPPQASLVLLPMRNATGDAGYDWIQSGIPDLLGADLLQSRALRLVEKDRVADVYEGLMLSTKREPPPETLYRMAGLLGADRLLTASLLKAGNRFRLEATINSVVGESISAGTPMVVEGEGEDSIFTMVDELSAKIRDDLGVSWRRGEKDRGVTELSTTSVEALRHYSAGLELARTGNHLEATRRIESALQADPEFAVARATLAEMYAGLGRGEEALAEAARAVQSIQKLSPYEAARIGAIQASLQNDAEAAEQAYTRLTDIAPNSVEAFFGLATVREDQGKLEGAMEAIDRVLQLDPKHADALYAQGRLYAKLDNLPEALARFNAALASHVVSGNKEGEGQVLNGIGNIYLFLDQLDNARDSYEKSMKIREKLGDRYGVSAALNNISSVHKLQGRLGEATETALQALQILQEIGDQIGMAQTYVSIGDLYQMAGRPEMALSNYTESLKILRDVGDEASLASTLSSVGYINTVMGNYVQAHFFMTEALAKRRDMGIDAEIIQSLNDVGILEQIQGRYEKAIQYNMDGLSLARRIGDRDAMVVFSVNLANIFEDQGDYGPALARLEEAEQIAREIESDDLIAVCLADQARTRSRLGDLTGAAQAIEQAVNLSREAQNTPQLIKALTVQADVLRRQGRPDEARAASSEAFAAAQQAGEHRLLLIARLERAKATGARSELEQVAQDAESTGLTPLVAEARLALANERLKAKRPAEALREAERAIAAGRPLRQRDLLFQAHHVAARALELQEDSAAALEHYLAAVDVLSQLRDGLEGEPLGHLLNRPQTASFGDTAETFLLAMDRANDADRLATVLNH